MNTYYVAPSTASPAGNNNNAGTISAPFLSPNKAWSMMSAGDMAYVRGGTFTYAMVGETVFSGKSGTNGNNILIVAYPGEKPIFNFSANTFTSQIFGIWIHDTSYITVKGIRITSINEPNISNPNPTYGLILYDNASNCTFDQIETDHIGGWGVHISDYCHYNTFINCDSHHNSDRYSNDTWGGADGFQSNSWNQSAGMGSTGNQFITCRAWMNSDDGWDLRRADGIWVLDRCQSFWNGYQPGEKLGDADVMTKGGDGVGIKFGTNYSGNNNSITKTAKNCLVFENNTTGIDLWTDGGYYWSGYGIYNNTVSGNSPNFGCDDSSGASATVLKNNISHKGSNYFYGSPWWTHNHNSWDIPITVSDSDFLSVDSTGMDGARQSDGSLPVLNFLKLASTAKPEYHAGVPISGITLDNAGNLWDTSTPSIGCYEQGTGPGGIPVTSVTVTGAGNATVISVDNGTLQMTATVLPEDATDKSVIWSVEDGSGHASIDQNGLLTAVTNGTVTVKATANG